MSERDLLCDAELHSWLCWVGVRPAVDAAAKKLSRGQLQGQSLTKAVTGSAAPQGVSVKMNSKRCLTVLLMYSFIYSSLLICSFFSLSVHGVNIPSCVQMCVSNTNALN